MHKLPQSSYEMGYVEQRNIWSYIWPGILKTCEKLRLMKTRYLTRCVTGGFHKNFSEELRQEFI